MNLHSIRARVAALSTLCVVAAAGTIVGYGVWSSAQTSRFVTTTTEDLLDRNSREALQLLAAREARTIKSDIDTAFAAARNMSKALGTLAASPEANGVPNAGRRAYLNKLLEQVLADNPGFNGTYSAWLPNALDGRDAEFKGDKTVGSDATGRALPYWTRNSAGQIGIQPLVEYDSAELHPNGLVKGGWFLQPQKTGKENMLAPLPYIVQGKSVFLATMSVPITVGDKFVGVVGADFDLAFVQKLAGEVGSHIYGGKGAVSIVTDAGLVVASTLDPSAIGGPYSKLSENSKEETALIASGTEKVLLDEAVGRYRVFAPLPIGRTGTYWSVVIGVDRSVVMEEAAKLSSALSGKANQDLFWQMIVAVAVTALAALAMILLGRAIASPIAALSAVLG